MRFALVDGVRSNAEPERVGQCPSCGATMIAKCGTQKIWHWAHKGERSCDPWWEPETEWHRNWKNHFPAEWQEQIGHDGSGEKHIADVRTPYGLVIEFQHSHLDPAERATRERYYGNMVWVVDGTRLKRDLPRFQKGINDARKTALAGVLHTDFPNECFPRSWLECSAPVFFDFGPGDEEYDYDPKHKLWCLLPGRNSDAALFGGFPRNTFVERAMTDAKVIDAEAIVDVLSEHARLAREAQERANREYLARERFYRAARRRRARF